MGKRNTREARPWTREEMIAYLDQSTAEETRVEKAVKKDFEMNRPRNTRGPGHFQAQAERDFEEQNRLYKAL